MTHNHVKLYGKPWNHFNFFPSIHPPHSTWSTLCYGLQVTWNRLRTKLFLLSSLLMQPIKTKHATYLQWQYSLLWTSPILKFQSDYKKCLLNMWLVGVTYLVNLDKKAYYIIHIIYKTSEFERRNNIHQSNKTRNIPRKQIQNDCVFSLQTIVKKERLHIAK